MADVAGWVGLVATCIAALMTASNLGARVTGWGFVVFTAGAIAWIVVALLTHQQQLLLSNVFLGLVDLFGIWRWLGRRARISDTLQAEQARSEQEPGEALFSTASLDGLPVLARNGDVAAAAVDALAACKGGRIDFLVIRAGGVGGIGERLHKLPWRNAKIQGGKIATDLDLTALSDLPQAAA